MIPISPFLQHRDFPVELQDAAVKLIRLDGALNASVPKPLSEPLKQLLRLVNSYYSSKIEGNSTTPADILRAQENSSAGKDDDNIIEIKHLTEIQVALENSNVGKSQVSSQAFLKHIHKSFYDGLPNQQCLNYRLENDEPVIVVPGEFRTYNVKVGRHNPPPPEQISKYMDWFASSYSLVNLFGLEPFAAAAAAHHRLMYIHPFLDGNGRVGRLFTDNYMRCAGLGGYGYWSMSRGFGRNSDSYYTALAKADHARKGDTDGRGILSRSGLVEFTEYFLKTALDQVGYFSTLLEPHTLMQRIDVYFELRNRGLWVSSTGKSLMPLPEGAREVYKSLLYIGAQSKQELAQSITLDENSLQKILKQMKVEKLVSAPLKSKISLELSPASIQILFPNLWT